MAPRLIYRVNYGNGQVFDAGTRADCFRHIAEMDQHRRFAFVEWQDPDTGDWFRTGNN
jgi:hypothetical protein